MGKVNWAMLLSVLCLSANALFGLSYFFMEVDGVPSGEQTQGQMQVLHADCEPGGAIDVLYFLDIDSSGTVEPEEPVMFTMRFMDNSEEFPPDLNPSDGEMEILWPLNMPPAHYVIRGLEGTDEMEFPYRVFAPEPLLHSVSGRIVLEGIGPPDAELAGFPFVVGTVAPPVLMFAVTDEWGDFSVNWPGEPDTLMAMFLMEIPGYNMPDMPMFYVDGHAEGWEILFTLGDRLSNLRMRIDGAEATVQQQGQNYVFAMDCREFSAVNIEFIVDEDGDGTIGDGDWNFFGQTWVVGDNRWVDEWFNDQDDVPGNIRIRPPFNLPPGDYIFHAFDDLVSLEWAFTVIPPEPLTHGVSGRVVLETLDPPDALFGELIVFMSDHSGGEKFYARPDEMGDFTLNWAYGDRTVFLGIEPPYPPGEWDFAGATTELIVDGILTDVELFVEFEGFADVIRVIFEQDDGLWDVRQGELKAKFYDPISGAIVEEFPFPESGDILLRLRPEPCGIIFEGITPEFALHNFISPWDTLWVSPDDYPETFEIFVSQACYHFKLGLEGFPPDSLPDDGIDYELYGEGPDGQRYYSRATMFIQEIGEELLVAGGRELCPATWTAILTDSLPGSFSAETNETTFVIPRVDTWPHMLILIPVLCEKISEAELPEELSLKLYPNPFNASVSIDFHVGEPGEVIIEVFDVMGRLVMTLAGTAAESGAYRTVWACRDDGGAPVSTGVYLFKITTPNETRIAKGMFIK